MLKGAPPDFEDWSSNQFTPPQNFDKKQGSRSYDYGQSNSSPNIFHRQNAGVPRVRRYSTQVESLRVKSEFQKREWDGLSTSAHLRKLMEVERVFVSREELERTIQDNVYLKTQLEYLVEKKMALEGHLQAMTQPQFRQMYGNMNVMGDISDESVMYVRNEIDDLVIHDSLDGRI
eukprot:TRINITY_DN961_c0_g1_i4.p1 TRINITY_DN961_c0_g1~~TRINITY_DN961_c0_g1_i4.p1  ORF type:complete len:175 (+),score=34.55 TRINITY_DN961_c0_g1_i4:583-1107(+)